LGGGRERISATAGADSAEVAQLEGDGIEVRLEGGRACQVLERAAAGADRQAFDVEAHGPGLRRRLLGFLGKALAEIGEVERPTGPDDRAHIGLVEQDFAEAGTEAPDA